MPRRPANHIVADQAVADVSRVWLDCGCACDRVESDYGEDLIVQPVQNEVVDPFRILVQVKGTTSLARYQRKDSNYTVSVPKETLYKWSRSSDLTVIVLWDARRAVGVWASPADDFEHSKFLLDPASSRKVIFSPLKRFDRLAVGKLCWKACARYFEALIAAETGHGETIEREPVAVARQRKVKRDQTIGLLSFELLARFGIIDWEMRFNPEVLVVAQGKAREFRRSRFSPAHSDSMAMVWTMLARVHACTGEGMRSLLLKSCSQMILKILHAHGPRPWNRMA
jgi:hypothetical protein